jgi:hypothetical protein
LFDRLEVSPSIALRLLDQIQDGTSHSRVNKPAVEALAHPQYAPAASLNAARRTWCRAKMPDGTIMTVAETEGTKASGKGQCLVWVTSRFVANERYLWNWNASLYVRSSRPPGKPLRHSLADRVKTQFDGEVHEIHQHLSA